MRHLVFHLGEILLSASVEKVNLDIREYKRYIKQKIMILEMLINQKLHKKHFNNENERKILGHFESISKQ